MRITATAVFEHLLTLLALAALLLGFFTIAVTPKEEEP
jgi:hypothetical protein